MKQYKIAESGTIEREVFKMGDANELVRIQRIKTTILDAGYAQLQDFINDVTPDVSLGTVQAILRGATVTEKQAKKIYELTGIDLLTPYLQETLRIWQAEMQDMNRQREFKTQKELKKSAD